VIGGPADGVEDGLEVGCLVVLLGGQRDPNQPLGDARVDDDGHRGARGTLAAEDLEALVVHGGGDLYRDRVRHPALAGEPVALADERIAQLNLVPDGWRWDRG